MDTTLLKGLKLLEVLAASGEARGVTELATELKLVKSNVHRLLQTLAHKGYARKSADGVRYECTLKIWELGELVAGRVDVLTLSRPIMRTLAEQTGETVHLSVLDGAEVLYIDKIDSPQPVRAYSRIGGRAPAHCVATGKALAAWASADAMREITRRMTRHTERSIAGVDELKRQLQRIRELGYAINRGEWRDSVGGVAAPIFDRRGESVAAIGISGPLERLTVPQMRRYAPHVVVAARRISAALGFSKAAQATEA